MATKNPQTPDGTAVSRSRLSLIGFFFLLAATVAAAQTPTTYEVVHGFRSTGKPMSALIQTPDGSFYGTTYFGGTSGVGTVFRLDSSNVTTVHSFNYADGAFPTAGLVYGTDGYFYGTTTAGGTGNQGAVFRMDGNGAVTVLHSFNGADGAQPNASLIEANDGNFYGTTSAGGGSGHIGTVFRLTTSGELTVLYRFSITDGFYPYASLVQASDGKLYGTTAGGGAHNLGTVFKIDTAGTLVTMHDFAGSDGENPYAALIQASDGNFYGTTRGNYSYGNIYRMTPQGEVTGLYNFNGGTDGPSPYAPLVQASDGNLYGVTGLSGTCSSVFRLELSGTFTQLYRFDNEADPYAALIQANDGDLYGTASAWGNGAPGIGSVFKINLAGIFTPIYAFAATEPAPRGRLVETGGLLYGTGGGGLFGSGAVYKIDPFGSLSMVHSLSGPDGVYLSNALCLASDGNLYGTTGGGSNGAGTAFKLQPSGDFATLHNFDFPEGSGPSELIQGTDGNFYGTAGAGGARDYGTIFRMSSSGDVTVLHDFQGSDGSNPDAGLVQAADGDYYGTTPYTLFKISSAGSFTKLFDFYEEYGEGPKSSLIQLADGNFYGVSATGGASNKGVVYTSDALGTVTPIHTFTGGDGSFPLGPLVQAGDGYLYGGTTYGGSCGLVGGCGLIYRVNAAGDFHVVYDGHGSAWGLTRASDGRLYGLGGASPFGQSAIFRLSSAQIAVNEVSPTSGAGEPGAALTVLGGGFPPGATVTIGGAAATDVTVVNATFLYLRMPALSPGTYDVTVAAPGGSPSATHPAAYVVNAPGPTITSFTPAAGPIGVKVTINGTGFTGITSVKFNGKSASFTALSPTQLTASVSGGTTSGKITVITSVGTATSATDFIVAGPPTVTGFSPGSGVPGSPVVVTGTNFDTASAVAFNGFGATFTINSPTQITATVPPSATTGKIKVTNAAGGAYSVAAFLVAPTITSFSPASGLPGTTVTINGNTFNGASSVTFNGLPAAFTLYTSVKITATVPAGVTTGKIAVTTPGGTATSATNFAVPPTITSFTPTAGPIGAHVTINGTGFTGASSVKFNGKAAAFSVLSPTQLSASVSGGTTTGKITVTTTGGTATSAANFVVVVPPTVTGFTPASGVAGTTVVITGTGFDTASAVAFNGFGAAFTINSPTQITATVPSSATTGKIKVTNAAGAASSVASFLVPPTITSFSPTSGHAGITVTINGKTFNNASSVTFNGVPASFTVYSSIKITATVPSGAATGKIKVITGGGSGTSATNFTVLP